MTSTNEPTNPGRDTTSTDISDTIFESPTASGEDTPATTEGTTAADASVGSTPAAPVWRTGPAPFPILLGLVGLLVAVGVVVAESSDLFLPWTDLGPWSIVIAGVLVIIVGAIGLRSSRTQD